MAAVCAAFLAALAGTLVLLEDETVECVDGSVACDAGARAATGSVNVVGIGLVAAAVVLAAVGLLLLRRHPSPGKSA